MVHEHADNVKTDPDRIAEWRSWLRGKCCETETYCPDVIARDLAREVPTTTHAGAPSDGWSIWRAR